MHEKEGGTYKGLENSKPEAVAPMPFLHLNIVLKHQFPLLRGYPTPVSTTMKETQPSWDHFKVACEYFVWLRPPLHYTKFYFEVADTGVEIPKEKR